MYNVGMGTKLNKFKVIVVRSDTSVDSSQQKVSRQDSFHKLSVKISNKLGNAWAFFIAIFIILLWGLTGPIFNYSDTWQLIINTGTTIVTFLMVFVIQNTQNRDGRAMQLKLDELIKSSHSARSKFVDVEDLNDSELDELQEQFHAIHQKIQDKIVKK
jgi:low affinity Fe/Cu permease